MRIQWDLSDCFQVPVISNLTYFSSPGMLSKRDETFNSYCHQMTTSCAPCTSLIQGQTKPRRLIASGQGVLFGDGCHFLVLLKTKTETSTTCHAPTHFQERRITTRIKYWTANTHWLKWGARGGSAPCSDLSPCNSMSPPDWIYKVLFYAQITPNQFGVEWVMVWGLLRPGFVRWVPPHCLTWPL